MSQVEMILNMLKPAVISLTADQKKELLSNITNLLGENSDSTNAPAQSQQNSISGVSLGGGNNSINFSPVQNQGGTVNINNTTEQSADRNEYYPQALESLSELKELIGSSTDISVKEGSEALQMVGEIEAEMEKEEPDTSFISKTINVLSTAINGVITLSEPAKTAFNLIQKAFGF